MTFYVLGGPPDHHVHVTDDEDELRRNQENDGWVVGRHSDGDRVVVTQFTGKDDAPDKTGLPLFFVSFIYDESCAIRDTVILGRHTTWLQARDAHAALVRKYLPSATLDERFD